MANKQGNPLFGAIRNTDTAAANRERSAKADRNVQLLAEQMLKLAATGVSQSEMADQLNALGLTTSRGKPWSRMAVWRYFQRLKALKERGVRFQR